MATVAEVRQAILDLLHAAATDPIRYADRKVGNVTVKPAGLIKALKEDLATSKVKNAK